MSNFDAYNQRVVKLQEENTENKRVELHIPEYLYRMIEEVADKDNTSKTAALVKMVRIGDFITQHSGEDKQFIVRELLPAEDDGDPQHVDHIINFE